MPAAGAVLLSRMSVGGFNCPWCRAYNAKDEKVCYRCGKPLGSPGVAGVMRTLSEVDMPATKFLAGLSILVFALEMASAGFGKMGLLSGLPTSVMIRFGGLGFGLEHHEPYRLLAACFVHLGLIHVAMNMLALAELGRFCESTIGGPRLIIGYVVTGLVGFLVSGWWYGIQFTAGASGAIFGIDGLVLGGMVIKRDSRWKDMLVRTVIQSFVFFFMLRTNQAAHLGGLACGLVMGVIFGLETRPWRRSMLVNIAAGVCVVACVVSVVLPHFSPAWRMVAAQEQRRQANDD